jgi:competence protein ComEA
MRLGREGLLTWGLVAACLVLAGVSAWPRLTVQRAPVSSLQPEIVVAVSGEVNAPGSYVLPWGARAEEAVRAAGGFTAQADRTLVNLAQPLGTGDALFVPGLRAETGEVRISINTATALELQQLPGVGPAISQRIVEGRPYGSVDDLLRVRGIGEKTLERLRPFVTL